MEKIIAFMIRKHIALVAILLVLGAIPFFWFKPGEVNIGGDSSRLFLYDPLNYLKNLALYPIAPGATGYEAVSYFFTPFVTLFIILKKIFVSPGLVTNVFHGFMLVTSFLFTYLTIVELLRRNSVSNRTFIFFAGCIGGLFYIFGPPVGNWDKAITSHNQIFLNPMIFFLLLKFFITDNPFYLTVILLISFVFSTSFSYIAAPPLFSFYPFTLVYLFIYKKYIVQTPFRWKALVLFLLLFFAIQAFHLVPQLPVLLNKTSYEFKHVFTSEGVAYGLDFFNATYQGIKLSKNLASIGQMNPVPIFQYVLFVFPIIIVLGLIVGSSDRSSIRQKLNHLFLTFILLIVLFFVTANITDIGLLFYQLLFRLPGFAMFRNYYGQFSYVFTFYYALVLGYSLYAILTVATKKIRILLYIVLPVILILHGWQFITGYMVKLPILGSKDVVVPQRVDPDFEKTLEYIRGIPTDGKFLTLPLTDFGYQMLAGANGGLYIGPSMIGHLTGKKDFMGYGAFTPFQEILFDRIKHKDFKSVQLILSLLNIGYVFYNSDSYIYDQFPGFPYNTVKKFFPTQQSVRDFIKNLDVTSESQFSDKYHIYERSDENYLPSAYIATDAMYWNALFIDLAINVFPLRDNRIAVINQIKDFAAMQDMETIYLESKNTSQYLELFVKRKSRYATPHISRKLSWLFYPLVALSERNDLRSYRLVNDAFIDRSIFYAEKRVRELDTWKNEIPLKGNVQSIKELDSTWKELREYNAWEISLVRYRRIIGELLSKLEYKNESKYSTITIKKELKNKFVNHFTQLKGIVIQSNKNKREKKYLLDLIYGTYDDIQSELNFSLPSATKLAYGIEDAPINGAYEVYVDKKTLDGLEISDIELVYADQKLVAQKNSVGDWLNFGEVAISIDSPQLIVFNTLNPTNLAKNVQWVSPADIRENNGNVTLSIDYAADDDFYGMTTEIKAWKPESYYLVSFDYQTYGNPFRVQTYELDKSTGSPAEQIMQDVLYTNVWKKYQAIIQSGDELRLAYLNILYDPKEKKEEISNTDNKPLIEIKNLSIAKILTPKMVLRRKIAAVPKQSTMPRIEFQKINPTRYNIKLTNVKEAFSLVFSQAYSMNWKLVDTRRPTKSFRGWVSRQSAKMLRFVTAPFVSPIVDSVAEEYYGGTVREKTSQQVFLTKETFDTWGKEVVADNRHILVNGYANGWYIGPEDFGGRDNYELVMEMTSQKLFYGSLAISLITFFGVLLAGVFFIIRRHDQ